MKYRNFIFGHGDYMRAACNIYFNENFECWRHGTNIESGRDSFSCQIAIKNVIILTPC